MALQRGLSDRAAGLGRIGCRREGMRHGVKNQAVADEMWRAGLFVGAKWLICEIKCVYLQRL